MKMDVQLDSRELLMQVFQPAQMGERLVDYIVKLSLPQCNFFLGEHEYIFPRFLFLEAVSISRYLDSFPKLHSFFLPLIRFTLFIYQVIHYVYSLSIRRAAWTRGC